MLPYMPVDMKPSPPRQRSQLMAKLKVLWLTFLKMFMPLRWITNCQFQLRTLFIFALLTAACAAWYAYERHECAQHEALAWQLEELGCRVTLVKKYCTPTPSDCRTGADSWWQRCLGDLCGDRIVHVTMDDDVVDYACDLLEGFTLELATGVVCMEADRSFEYELEF